MRLIRKQFLISNQVVNHVNISIPAENSTCLVNLEAYGFVFLKETGRTK